MLCDEFVRGVFALGKRERFLGALVVAAQHVGIALVIEDLRPRADELDRLGIGAVGEIEAAQPVAGSGKAKPGLCVARMQFDRVTEMLFGEAEIIGVILLLAKAEIVVGVARQANPRRRRPMAERIAPASYRSWPDANSLLFAQPASDKPRTATSKA